VRVVADIADVKAASQKMSQAIKALVLDEQARHIQKELVFLGKNAAICAVTSFQRSDATDPDEPPGRR
jgi:hypothetical protein